MPTIIEPLRADWELVQGQVKELRDKGDHAGALAAIKAYHHTLCTTRVLDPACGTGNFLYVSLELMKRLEGEVLEALDELGENQARFAMEGETVNPRQFFGLEINPRAVPIADLVLWIGYLKWQLRTAGLASIAEPVLHAYGTIRQQDAVIAYDKQELLRDANGKPLSRWDGVTKKLHPVTGEEVPDPDAQVPLFSYKNPRRAVWPEAEFIVGNPPFIGGKDMRAELGDGYAEACWAARPDVPGGADFVMHFWDEAAKQLVAKSRKGRANPTRRFGFITTNSVTQTFSRRVIEKYISEKVPLSLIYAVPDHPWLKAADKAAVRIAITVSERGNSYGILSKTISETGLGTDTPQVLLESRTGKIQGSLNLGASLSEISDLLANEYLGFKGYMPWGNGFLIDEGNFIAQEIRKKRPEFLLRYFNGRDLAQRPRGKLAIDFYDQDLNFVRQQFPHAYQHLLDTVKVERDLVQRQSYRDNWWIFAEPRPGMRHALKNLSKYIATAETARHRLFTFLPYDAASDQKIRVIASDQAAILATCSSRIHVIWSFSLGGWQGVGGDPVYNNSTIFCPLPFPPAIDSRTGIAESYHHEHTRLRELGERLDAFRKERLAEHAFLTMTGLYNALERLREVEHGYGAPLTPAERDVHQAGLISVLKEIHDDIDRAVFAAYGWNDLAPALVGRPGATLPSPHKTPDQEQAEAELLSRLVALNHERADEEKRGLVRWLRPDYQIPKLGAKAPKARDEHVGTLDVALPEVAERPKWPADGLEQIRLVRDLLAKAPAPAASDSIASVFDGRATPTRRKRVTEVLETLVATGLARTGEESGQRRYFLPR